MSINENTIYVLPCLQELKEGGRVVGAEYEQQPGKWNGTEVVPLFSGFAYGSGDGSDKFDEYWSGKSNNPNNDITKNGLLTIPDCSSFGFKSNNYVTSTQCKDFSCTQKWSIYTKFLKSKCPTPTANNVALLVTHHNRMRDLNLMQGLLPFKDNSPYNAYANNICLKISISDNKVSYSLFFEGFPDKGDFEDCISVDVNRIDDGGVVIGGGKYKYFCNKNIENFINTELITKGINDAGINGIKLDIYVIRHGNALHNKPVSISDFATTNQNRLDSSLTPLGMYQAKILGDYFMSESVLNNANIILCCSFLQRTQLTGLLLLYYAGIELGNNMRDGMINMLNQAIIRYSKAQENGFKPTKFLGYSPLGKIIKDNNGDKKYEPFKEEDTKFVEYLFGLNDLLEGRKSAQKAIEELNDNLVKNSVIQTSDGWNEIPGADPDDEDDDAPRFIPNQGGKKRRQTKKHRAIKSKKVRRVKKSNKKSKKVKRRSNKRKA
jgi:hypothetical protein